MEKIAHVPLITYTFADASNVGLMIPVLLRKERYCPRGYHLGGFSYYYFETFPSNFAISNIVFTSFNNFTSHFSFEVISFLKP